MPDRVARNLGIADAEDLCDHVYRSRAEALEVARRLQAAGWIVPLLDAPATPGAPRAGGIRVLACVYHPVSYESPGEVVYTGAGG
jgi:hypothetical protein